MKMKDKLLLCIIFLSVLAIVCSFVYKRKQIEVRTRVEEAFNTEVTYETLHDWETKFIIEDGYNGKNHYINEYKRNIDHSITFVGDDGLLWTIPYPYFYIHVNHRKVKDQPSSLIDFCKIDTQ